MGLYLKAIFISGALSLSGCLESSFELAHESRLPKWFTLPDNLSRNDVSVTMNYYISLSSGKGEAVFSLKRSDGRKLQKIKALTGRYPLELKNKPEGFPKGYPKYEVITVNGITDIVEHRKMEPFFYMTNDPVVWRELIGSRGSAGINEQDQ